MDSPSTIAWLTQRKKFLPKKLLILTLPKKNVQTKKNLATHLKKLFNFLYLHRWKKISHQPKRTNFLLKEKLFILTKKTEKEKISYSFQKKKNQINFLYLHEKLKHFISDMTSIELSCFLC